MKEKSKAAPIKLPTDTQELKGQICQLQQKKYRITRPNEHQIKIAKYNWYWSTGKITIDPCVLYKFKGFEAFLALIELDISLTHDWLHQRSKIVHARHPISTETL